MIKLYEQALELNSGKLDRAKCETIIDEKKISRFRDMGIWG